MPADTPVAAAKSHRLSTQEATEKFAGLISSPSQDEPSEPSSTPEPTPAPETPDAPPPPESTPEEPSEVPTYELTVDGETLTVDLDELKAGYSRDADYRRKTMTLAEERRAFESERVAVQQERQQYQTNLAQLTQALEQLQGEPDWDALHRELAPAEFLKQKADWEHSRAHLERLKAEQARVQAEQERQQAQQMGAYLRAEADKLRAAVPEWAEPEKAKALQTKLATHLKSYGFSEEQIAGVSDARLVLLALDAMKYRELRREPSPTAKAKTQPIRPATPGKPAAPRPNERQQKLVERAAQTRRTADAAKAIEAMLGDD